MIIRDFNSKIQGACENQGVLFAVGRLAHLEDAAVMLLGETLDSGPWFDWGGIVAPDPVPAE